MNAPAWFKPLVKTARLMVGVHDYDAYLAHYRDHHPDQKPLSREAFFRACQEARYPGKKGTISRCPC